MMKKVLTLLLLVISTCVSAQTGRSDTLPDGIIIEKHVPRYDPQLSLTGQLSQTGFSTAFTGMMRYRSVAFSAGGKIVHSKTYRVASAPYGVIAGVYFFPNRYPGRINGLMNIDYQLTFQGNASTGKALDHLVHEYTAGYGFYFIASSRIHIMSAINFGRYTEVMESPYTGARETFSGYSSLLRLGINYRLRE